MLYIYIYIIRGLVTINASQYTSVYFGHMLVITQYNFTLDPWYIGCHALTMMKAFTASESNLQKCSYVIRYSIMLKA